MIYAYIRVSTDRQNTNNQRFAINEWAMQNNIDIDYFVDETASGKIAIDHRNLGKLFNKLKNGDTLIVAELSRLGRSMLDVIEKINWCLKNNIKMYSIKEKFALEDSIVSKTLIFAFTISAEIERQLISDRTKEALHRRKMEGMKLGRPVGSKNSIEANPCYPAFKQILKWDRQGISHSKIARRIGVHRDTLRRFLIKCNLGHLLRGRKVGM
ncbi:recombinase family protein [Campylobacter fetus subsp. venerealis]|uniref:Site-specific recombinase/resolvase n=1 Tax=Campylobacter hyointestinalis subsp. hyointestinalis TaxID=91352 RepID=A0A9W5AQW0_CAMHY|nr:MULTISPECIES: recombinase family protein [Campylobacter]MBC3779843.1 recombinase family protein [Campylobacter fetus subsp. fetus]MBC3782203.1 recombinase family protein [Campylobacter fetus subsp. venerealis]MBK3499389.1 recombinase family protein [Campylobacter fetus subsp. venerealis]MBK3501292.1 recombinase family protein [Campylobacter fetus subsp. venerealis]MBK3503349.1 recombinase family protein [Campylobacter fetus subsp. venerealis]